MSQQIRKNDMLPYEEDLMKNRYLLTMQVGDVTGDGIPDKVYLYGSKTADTKSSFVDNISIVIEDGYSGKNSTITPDFNAGYNPRLFLGDFTADGRACF